MDRSARRFPSLAGNSTKAAVAQMQQAGRKPPAFLCQAGMAERLAAELIRLHPVKTAECVAAATGCPVRTAQNWIEHRATPSLVWFVRLVAAYGPGLLAALLPVPIGWLDDAARQAEHEALTAQIATLQARARNLCTREGA